MKRFSKSTGTFVLAAVACSAALGGGVALAENSHGGPEQVAKAAGISPVLRAHFAFLGTRAVHTADASTTAAEPASVAAMIKNMSDPADPSNMRLGLITSDVQQLPISATQAWLVPGSNGACLVSTKPMPAAMGGGLTAVAVCNVASAIAQNGIATTGISPSGAPVFYGLLPNGGSSFTLTGTSSSNQSVPISDNAFATPAPSAGTSMTFIGGAGKPVTTPAS